MSAKDTATSSASISFPFFSLLTVLLVIAKLTGHFAYSWWIVFLPFLFPIGIFFAALGIVGLIVVLAALIQHYIK